ncbi:MAG: hypothetical protein JHC33_12495 [Ignisphaera sp.]|jgi:hypothetical protein|nr:hypothetical protein [Ignisphaera sp.]
MSLIGALVKLEAALLAVKCLVREDKQGVIPAIEYLYPKVGAMINDECVGYKNEVKPEPARCKK